MFYAIVVKSGLFLAEELAEFVFFCASETFDVNIVLLRQLFHLFEVFRLQLVDLELVLLSDHLPYHPSLFVLTMLRC